MKILFVCSSNVCRSPYCEYLFKRDVSRDEVLSAHIDGVRSAAVLNISREIFPKAVVALEREGFSKAEILAHKPFFKWCDLSRFKEADVIVGMSRFHKLLTPAGCRKKYVTLSEAAEGKYTPIPDPFLAKSQEEYDRAMAVLKDYLVKYEKKLKTQFNEA